MSHPASDHPANAGLRRHRKAWHPSPDLPPVAFPDQVLRPYDQLGTHPDLVARLWDEIPRLLPEKCRAIFFGLPALIHPRTGIVFGFASGTHTYALRLPQPQRSDALRAGATRVKDFPGGQPSLDLDEIGKEWVFCGWFRDEEAWCLAAFGFAGGTPRTQRGD